MRPIRWVLLLLTLLGGLNLAACDREGPLERAGESADRAGEDVKDAVDNDRSNNR